MALIPPTEIYLDLCCYDKSGKSFTDFNTTKQFFSLSYVEKTSVNHWVIGAPWFLFKMTSLHELVSSLKIWADRNTITFTPSTWNMYHSWISIAISWENKRVPFVVMTFILNKHIAIPPLLFFWILISFSVICEGGQTTLAAAGGHSPSSNFQVIQMARGPELLDQAMHHS